MQYNTCRKMAGGRVAWQGLCRPDRCVHSCAAANLLIDWTAPPGFNGTTAGRSHPRVLQRGISGRRSPNRFFRPQRLAMAGGCKCNLKTREDEHDEWFARAVVLRCVA